MILTGLIFYSIKATELGIRPNLAIRSAMT